MPVLDFFTAGALASCGAVAALGAVCAACTGAAVKFRLLHFLEKLEKFIEVHDYKSWVMNIEKKLYGQGSKTNITHKTRQYAPLYYSMAGLPCPIEYLEYILRRKSRTRNTSLKSS